MASNKLEYFKKKILAILDQREKEGIGEEADASIAKSLEEVERISKSLFFETMGSIEKARKYGVGTIRIWRGKKYKKVSEAPTRWVRVYDKVDRGAKSSMTRLKNKVKACQSLDELMQFCMSNHALFKDANGVDLPIMDELRAEIDSKNDQLSGKAPAPKTLGEASGKTYEQFKNDVDKIYPTDKKEIEKLKEKNGVTASAEEIAKLDAEAEAGESANGKKEMNEAPAKKITEAEATKFHDDNLKNIAEIKERYEKYFKEQNEKLKGVKDVYTKGEIKGNIIANLSGMLTEMNKECAGSVKKLLSKDDFNIFDKIGYGVSKVDTAKVTMSEINEAYKKILGQSKEAEKDIKNEREKQLERVKKYNAEIDAKKNEQKPEEKPAEEPKTTEEDEFSKKVNDWKAPDTIAELAKEENPLFQAELKNGKLVIGNLLNGKTIKQYNATPFKDFQPSKRFELAKMEREGKITANERGNVFERDGKYYLLRKGKGLNKVGEHYSSNTDTIIDLSEESEAEKHQNRSDAMKGNKNAFKGGPKEKIPDFHFTMKEDFDQIKNKYAVNLDGLTDEVFNAYVDTKTKMNNQRIEENTKEANNSRDARRYTLIEENNFYINQNRALDELKKERIPAEKPQEKAPATPEETIKQAKAEAKKWEDMFSKYANDWDDGITYAFNIPKNSCYSDPEHKARYRARGLENIMKMKAELEPMGIKVPDIPEEIQKKWDSYKEAVNTKGKYSTSSEDDRLLSGIKQSKFDELGKACIDVIREQYKQAKSQIPTDENTDATNPPVAGKTNEEHSKMFDYEKDENGDRVLTYNGKKYGNGKINWYNDIAKQRELVEKAGMDSDSQIDWLKEQAEKPGAVVENWALDHAYGRYGKDKLKELADTKLMSDEEFYKKLREDCKGKQRDRGFIERSIHNHISNQKTVEYAQKRLADLIASEEAINDIDLPVDPKDMDEAESIIGRDVRAGWWGQGLKDKIERRVRNNPAVARAMLVYIKNYQNETGKTVFTPRNEIWKLLPKLNENARNAVMNGTDETDRTSSGAELYSGDGVTSVVENKELGRYQVFFNGKPDADTRNTLKRNGFRWAPSNGSWQCFNTSNGERSLARVAEALGWKKN